MKIEFRREERGGFKVVMLYVGGRYVCGSGEQSVRLIDWKNASEAEHACREELKKWMGEEKPPKPEQLTVTEAWSACDEVDEGNDPMSMAIEAVEKRTRLIVAWEQEHGDE